MADHRAGRGKGDHARLPPAARRNRLFLQWTPLLLILILLPACGGVSSYSSDRPVVSDPTRVIRYVSSNLESQQPRIVSELARDYEREHPSVRYEFENVNTSDLLQRIQLLAASNDLPELFTYESGKPLQQLSEHGFVLDIEQAFGELGLGDALNPTAVKLLKSMTGGKGLYALPLEINIEGFWYNKTLFEQNGIEVPKTWDQLLQAAETLEQAGVQPFAVAGSQKWTLTRLINGYVVRKYGFDAMARVSRGELSLTDPGFVEAADVVQRMALQGYFGDHVNTTDLDEATAMFLQGRAAIYYTGSWSLRDFNDPKQNRIGEDRIGLFNIPLVPGGAGGEGDWLLNAGLTTSFSAAGYDDEMKRWMKSVFSDYGNKAMSEMGIITGFKTDRLPQTLPPLTQLAQSKIDGVQNGTLWFEAFFNAETQATAWNNAQLLVSSASYTPAMYMADLQVALDKQLRSER
ncbi:raffinose/stachyose/melibiose transport system substrate-binding protein [Cohnella sp. OV330]|uniref:ABC transporter substrate-binding protein n=1 Tax=Cohnella sp. OV330 TaxID=1855288 RepID=UPI0008E3A3F8|nr:extracellular solute-binding protein [Cohnella sp. OV330]SFB06157.1 raffinose/stachyose/melibiose transport system substrate-binding protein [Cohnella sp. OV330]